jgi:rod shape-determining protein MreB and related proteins
MTSLLSRRRPEIAIDFGTANVRVIRRDEGIVFSEPSLCCFHRRDGVQSFVAAGSEAHAMIDRTPTSYHIQRPLSRGVLQDIEAAKSVLRHALSRTSRRRGTRAPRALIGVPADSTQAERSAMLTAAHDAGLAFADLIIEPLAAAVGAGLPVTAAAGSMLIECGAGTTEVAVFALGGVCETGSVRIGGSTLDRAIADHLHLRHKFLIGERTAERVKLAYVADRLSRSQGTGETITAKGRSLRTGLPTTLDVELDELDRVAEKHASQIVRVVRDVLVRTPPELSRDIWDRGVVLTGGGAFIPMLRTMISDATGLKVEVADQPEQCVALGLHRMLTS